MRTFAELRDLMMEVLQERENEFEDRKEWLEGFHITHPHHAAHGKILAGAILGMAVAGADKEFISRLLSAWGEELEDAVRHDFAFVFLRMLFFEGGGGSASQWGPAGKEDGQEPLCALLRRLEAVSSTFPHEP